MSKLRQHDDRRGAGLDGSSVLLSLVSAGLFLYVGFVLGLEGVSDSPIYNTSVAALVWGARVVGIGLLVATAMLYLRLPGATLVDLLLAAMAAAGCLVIGVIWLLFGDMQGILLLLFGALNASSARQAWSRWAGDRAGSGSGNSAGAED